MTYSLVARDGTGTLGVATASKFLAVGATVPAVAARAGALVTQAHTNAAFGEAGLALLRTGAQAQDVVHRLIREDPGRDLRQLAVLGRRGPAATWTGPGCSDVAGHRLGDDCVAIGNLMADAAVLEALVATFTAAPGPLPERLVLALAAGEEAGGDRRGRQSSALLVLGPGELSTVRSADRVDLRVDDHPDPVAELRRLLELHRMVVTGPDVDAALPLSGALADEVDLLLLAAEHRDGTLAERLVAWAHSENLEHRLVPGRVDAGLLDGLRRRAGAVRRPRA